MAYVISATVECKTDVKSERWWLIIDFWYG